MIAAGAAMLMLPVARAGEGSAPLLTALFTSTSAVAVTGLTTVDTATYWSPAGQAMIAVLIQIGGLGILTTTSLALVVIFRRVGFRSRMLLGAPPVTGPDGLARPVSATDLRRSVLTALGVTIAVEVPIAIAIGLRLLADGSDPGNASASGAFHAISAFNNAGFALYSDSLEGFAGDPLMLTLIALPVVIGGLGVPVWFDLMAAPFSPRAWDLHTKLTILASVCLLVVGAAAVALFEWGNRATLGALGVGDRLTNAVVASVMPRTAGFNAIDYGDVEPETLLVTDVLMLIGGGSASTAGGLKVTTFVVLALMALAEARGSDRVVAFGRSIPSTIQRRAVALLFFALGIVGGGTTAILASGSLSLDEALFEAISATATVGLSTGVTGQLDEGAQVVVIGMMYAGRIGLITLPLALALRARRQAYRHPEEAVSVG